MNISHDEIFNKTLNLLVTQIGDTPYQIIKTLEPLGIKDDCFYFYGQNIFSINYIEKNFITYLKKYLQQAADKELNIKFILDKNEFKNSEEKDTKEVYQLHMDLDNSNLLNKYTFDNFVVGQSNKIAQAASIAVAESPGKDYNPLFIYGGSGLGKTHLMHAIGNHIKKKKPNAKIIYVTSEQFTNEFIASIRYSKNQEFRDKYRNVDVLLIDDIQFIPGKEATELEFFHTFNELKDVRNAQIVISSDKHPTELKGFEERLKSRFTGGLSVDIQPPDLETRIAILKKKADIEGFNMPDEVYFSIATKVNSNIRELEGVLIRLIAITKLTGEEVSEELIIKAMESFSQNTVKMIDCEYIIEFVAKKYSITVDDMLSKNRSRNIAYPRQIAMYISRELTDLSLPKIGAIFGGRDHSTIMHGIDKIIKDMSVDQNFKHEIIGLMKKIKEN